MITYAVTIYAAITAAAAIYILIVTLLNESWMLHTNVIKLKESGVLVSVLVPARNEKARIEACLDSLLAQSYDNLEIIVYDDDSTDGTSQILDRYEDENPDLIKVIHGSGLEKGWYGKPHALQRLSEAATGAWLYFTDADTVHEPGSWAFPSVWPSTTRPTSSRDTCATGSAASARPRSSRHLPPLDGGHAALAWPPSEGSFHLPRYRQSMLFKTTMYMKIGGYSSVKDRVSEDVRIARIVKRHGGKVVFSDLKEWVSCRMYDGYKNAITGLSKNVYDYFNKNVFLLVGATIAVPSSSLSPS